MAGRIFQTIKDGKEGIIIGFIVGGLVGFLGRNFVNIDLFSQSQGLLDTLAAVEPSTKMWVTLAFVGAAIGFFIDVNFRELKGRFR